MICANEKKIHVFYSSNTNHLHERGHGHHVIVLSLGVSPDNIVYLRKRC